MMHLFWCPTGWKNNQLMLLKRIVSDSQVVFSHSFSCLLYFCCHILSESIPSHPKLCHSFSISWPYNITCSPFPSSAVWHTVYTCTFSLSPCQNVLTAHALATAHLASNFYIQNLVNYWVSVIWAVSSGGAECSEKSHKSMESGKHIVVSVCKTLQTTVF